MIRSTITIKLECERDDDNGLCDQMMFQAEMVVLSLELNGFLKTEVALVPGTSTTTFEKEYK